MPHALPDTCDAVPTPSELDVELMCPISLQVMQHPVQAADGHTYERAAIAAWLAQHNTSPMTGLALAHTRLAPATALEERVAAWHRAHREYRLHNTRPELETLGSTIFADLDKFSNDSLVVELGLRVPAVVVLGMESHGKSTLLERLIGFPILPRNARVCTRMVIRVTLRRGPAQVGEVGLYAAGAGVDAAPQEPPRHVALEKICEAVQGVMDACVQRADGAVYVVDREIRVTIQVPYCPNLNVIDLPGFVSGAGAKETEAMAERVVASEKDNAIFLFVNDARAEPKLSTAARIIADHGVADKTLGVFTFIDQATEAVGLQQYRGKRLSRLFSPDAEHTAYAEHGWVGVGSPSDQAALVTVRGCREVARLHQVNDFEAELVEMIAQETDKRTGERTLVPGLEERLGAGVARQCVQRLFELFIVTHWVPNLRRAVSTHFVACDEKNTNELGQPIPIDEAYAPHLATIRECAAFLPDGYDVATADMVGCAAMKQLVAQQQEALCGSTTRDPFNLGGAAAVWSSIKAVELVVSEKKVAWSAHSYAYQEAHGEASGAVDDLTQRCRDLVAALDNLAGALSRQLRAVVFTAQGARLERMGPLADAFEAFATRRFRANAKQFVEAAHKLVEAAAIDATCVTYAMPAPGNMPTGTVVWRREGEKRRLGHDILRLWLSTVVEPVKKQMALWDETPPITETCHLERVALLSDMARSADVLRALEELVARIEDDDAAPTPWLTPGLESPAPTPECDTPPPAEDSNVPLPTPTPDPAPVEGSDTPVPTPDPTPVEGSDTSVPTPDPAPVEASDTSVPTPDPAPVEASDTPPADSERCAPSE